MTMDTPIQASSALDTVQAAAELAKLLDPQPVETQPEEPAKVEPEKAPEVEAKTEEAPQEEAATDPDETITIEVDGKAVEIKKSELPDLYKGNLRQADYTKKTMEAAEQRKAAESEATKAREERQKYAEGLQQAQSLLQAQLQEQSQIDWQKLLETDPVEYLRQQHLANARQAKLGEIQREQQQVHAKFQQEQAAQMQAFLRTQQEELLAKLPEWKDEAKAKADKGAIKDYLKTQGLEDAQIDNISDHRVVLLSRKAMLYDQMMVKAKAASERMKTVPPKVERPGGGDTSPLDGRTTAMKQLSKSGKVEDAARVFASLL